MQSNCPTSRFLLDGEPATSRLTSRLRLQNAVKLPPPRRRTPRHIQTAKTPTIICCQSAAPTDVTTFLDGRRRAVQQSHPERRPNAVRTTSQRAQPTMPAHTSTLFLALPVGRLMQQLRALFGEAATEDLLHYLFLHHDEPIELRWNGTIVSLMFCHLCPTQGVRIDFSDDEHTPYLVYSQEAVDAIYAIKTHYNDTHTDQLKEAHPDLEHLIHTCTIDGPCPRRSPRNWERMIRKM